jgi:hypothetical protein
VETRLATERVRSLIGEPESDAASRPDPDEEAFDGFPWFNQQGRSEEDAVSVALFGQALHVDLLDVSCDLTDPQLVQCQAHTADDLSAALGGGVVTETLEFSFNDSGEITGFVSETQDGGVGETFTNWAWNIAYPGICDSPAQCALALLDIVDEYNETYPGATVASYVAAYNSGDIDAVMALFTEESTVMGHPMSNASGLAAIQRVQVQDMGAAADADAYSISNLDVTGNTVTWNQVWIKSDGRQFCQTGQSAVIEDSKFVSWTWPPSTSSGSKCP